MTAFRELREAVLEGNLALPAHGLVTLTWGNASQIDRDHGVFGIKPSGVSYEAMTAEDIVIVDLDGSVVDGERGPSTDTPTHLELYRQFDEIGGIVHTHSTWATVWAQAQREIPLFGTTHADLCAQPIPVTRWLTDEEIDEGYERNTGVVLIETITEHGGADKLPAVLIRGHAPFTWGTNLAKAVEVSVVLEEVAHMAFLTETLAPSASLDASVRNKHYERKHGPNAYYGQR